MKKRNFPKLEFKISDNDILIVKSKCNHRFYEFRTITDSERGYCYAVKYCIECKRYLPLGCNAKDYKTTAKILEHLNGK
jgi:hypothetical protein